jgi:hypothetical protein
VDLIPLPPESGLFRRDTPVSLERGETYMDMIPVASSNISAIGWEERQSWAEVAQETEEEPENKGWLTIEFKNGRTYNYYNVPESVYEELKSSPSIGKAFQSLVRAGGYAYEQV